MLTKEENRIKDNLFNELFKQTGFRNLSMDAQGEVVNEFVKTVVTLREAMGEDESASDEGTLHDCPRCGGTNESFSGFCTYPGCKNGMVDDRPERDDF